MKNLILDYMEATAARLPEKTAFADENSSVTFSALVARAKAVASALCGYVPPRSVIGFYMDKGVDTAIGFMGAVYAAVPIRCSTCAIPPRAFVRCWKRWIRRLS